MNENKNSIRGNFIYLVFIYAADKLTDTLENSLSFVYPDFNDKFSLKCTKKKQQAQPEKKHYVHIHLFEFCSKRQSRWTNILPEYKIYRTRIYWSAPFYMRYSIWTVNFINSFNFWFNLGEKKHLTKDDNIYLHFIHLFYWMNGFEIFLGSCTTVYMCGWCDERASFGSVGKLIRA